MKASLAFAASLVASAVGHATFQELWVNGVDQGSYCARLPPSNNVRKLFHRYALV